MAEIAGNNHIKASKGQASSISLLKVLRKSTLRDLPLFSNCDLN